MTPLPPTPAQWRIREHVLGHLTPGQQRVLPYLLEPITLDEVAERAGFGNRTSVEYHWWAIESQLGLLFGSGSSGIARLALMRMAFGIDGCFCE